MGHDVSIHKHIYRQPLATHDILRMSKILEVAQCRDDELENSSDESDEEGILYTRENVEKGSSRSTNRIENKEQGADKKKRSRELWLYFHNLSLKRCELKRSIFYFILYYNKLLHRSTHWSRGNDALHHYFWKLLFSELLLLKDKHNIYIFSTFYLLFLIK